MHNGNDNDEEESVHSDKEEIIAIDYDKSVFYWAMLKIASLL